jgi:hypothetical protein
VIGEWKHKGSPATIDSYASGKVVFTSVPTALLYSKAHGESGDPESLGPLVNAIGAWSKPYDSGSAYPIVSYDLSAGGFDLSVDGYTNSTRVIEFLYGDDREYSYTFHRVSESPAN